MANSDAGTSSGSARRGKYQVFLNFCGRDTRDGFTSFLYGDLRKNGIHAFIDDEELRVGEEIGGELLQAIDDSQIYITIFSKNYASSKWCLRELTRMVNNKSKSEEKKIMPIFYDVEPDDVDLKTPLYKTAIKKHKKEHKEKFPHEVESWEEALKKVDKIKGWVLPKCKNQAELVDSTVDEVLQELKIRHKFVTKDLVGLDHQVAKVLEKLDVNHGDEVRLLGIYGMGGIGKTTIAGVVYNKLSSYFGKCCTFLDNIRETCFSKNEGLLWLQKKLLTEIDSSRAAKIIHDVDHGRRRIEATLGNKKVFIVLDDVDEKKQIENLIGQGWLYPGTRIIITTRNTSVLEFTKQRMAPERAEVNFDHAIQVLPYEMEGMKSHHALQLFKRHAFRGCSLAKDFDSLSIDIVKTTGGLPLALEVIGSFLYDKNEAIWNDTLDKLKEIPDENVQKQLMISYDTLNNRQCNIFLDIACYFINEDMTNPIYMWTDCKFYPNLEINILVSMSLIKIRHNNNFWMHDQLRDLGREIVRRENLENFRKRSRLWTSEEVLDLVRTEESKEDVGALDLRGGSSHILISHEEIGSFNSLRFLRLSEGTLQGDFIVSLPNLRWISWRSPRPNVSVPSMHSKKLVVLELFDNHFTDDSKVWDLIKMATKLKNLTLVECHGITRTPNLSGCLVLERLTFDDCKNLKEIDSSIGWLNCLLYLNITNCGLIERVPDAIGGLVKLQHFSLQSCDRLSGLPSSIGDLASLRKFDLSYTGITSLPESIEKLQWLSDLCLKDAKIMQLPNSIGKLTSLCNLDLSKHKTEKIIDRRQFPEVIGFLDKMEELSLGPRNELVGEIPDEIGDLSSLRVLDLCWPRIFRGGGISTISTLSTLDLIPCDEIMELPELPASLVHLRVKSCSLQVIPNLSKLTNLVELVLSDGSDDQDSSNLEHTCDLGWIGKLSKLEELELCLLNIAVPPTDLGFLTLLKYLVLRGLDLQPLEQLPPSLLSLELDNFSSIGLPLSNLKILSNLTFRVSRLREIRLYELPQLQHLDLDSCDFQSLSIPSSLMTLTIYNCRNMIEIQFLGMLASLEELSIDGCGPIGRMVLCGEGGSLRVLDQLESSSSESTYCLPGVLVLPNALKKLKQLRLWSCGNLLEIQVIGTLLSLQDISIQSCNAMKKFSGLSNLKNLHRLVISKCSKLRVVEGLDELEFLTRLYVSTCPLLETLLGISNSKIPDDCSILVSCCRDSLNSPSLNFIPFKHYKMMARQGAPQPETNKEAKMEGDAVEPDTELQSLFHSSASSWDHEISEEPPTDNVREGTPLEKQNQTTEKDSNPSSLDEVAPPRAFCDRFMTCLASILECVCYRDSPSINS